MASVSLVYFMHLFKLCVQSLNKLHLAANKILANNNQTKMCN